MCISSELTRWSSRSVLFTRDLTLDVSVRNRDGRFSFSKYCTMAGTRHTRHEAIRFTYKQMQYRDILFRYANRHDFIARPSDCSPRAIFLSLSSSLLFLSLTLLQPPIFCYLYTKPSRVVAVRQRRRWRQCRQQKISNKSFRNPASLLSASPDFHYSLLCHLRTLPKLFLFPLTSPYRPVKRENCSISFLSFFLSSSFLDSHYPIFIIFFFLLLSRFWLHFGQPALSFDLSFFLHFFLCMPSLSRNLSSGQRSAL